MIPRAQMRTTRSSSRTFPHLPLSFSDSMCRIGIAVGPRTWFGNQYLQNISFSGTVLDNRLSGAFSYGIAMSSAANFTIENNVMFGNYSFIGASGPNCSTSDIVPTPAAFVYDNSSTGVTIQSDFLLIPDANSLTCVLPPDNGDYWPYGGDPGSTSFNTSAGQSSSSSSSGSSGSSGSSSTKTHKSSTAAIVIGVLGGIAAFAVVIWFVRKWLLKRIEEKHHYNSSKTSVAGKGPGYVKHA
jgi:parallel beta-helix repeat protein